MAETDHGHRRLSRGAGTMLDCAMPLLMQVKPG